MLPDELMDRFKEQAKGNKMMYLELCLDRFEWNLANENVLFMLILISFF